MKPLRIGLIGCGHIAKKHLATIQKNKDLFQLTDVCDTNPEQMDVVMQDYQLNNITTHISTSSLLSNKELDVVVITTPSSLHYSMVQSALQLKKHVIVEKPLTLNLKEVDHLIQLATLKQREIFVCHQLRYRPIFQEIKNKITDNAFGKIYSGVGLMRINRSSPYFEEATWRGIWQTDGGMLCNQGLHFIDLLCWFMGDLASIQGKIVNTRDWKETEDIATAILNYRNGSVATIYSDIVTNPSNIGYLISITAEKGTVSISGPNFNQLERFYLDGADLTETLAPLTTDTEEHSYMYQAIYKQLVKEDTTSSMISPTEARKSLECLFGIYQSSLLSKEQAIPVKQFATTDMTNVFIKGSERHD
ncbi:Gfo/Idh/MocA family protein [Paraliobacillus ryukyuensis]|uniref:Gfo/Idh/MocA family protein n=1 Tax=Paraliobacillus ryukyuensis TaxID=200904 RepID=UPI0009A8B26E|nr:Gfo/Idh/MocA family oxidoreductase [Paraliobacillus ryukyuensis]